MPDDVTNLRVTLTRIHVNEDEDRSGPGELYFDGDVDGVQIPRGSEPFRKSSGEDISLSGSTWEKIIRVEGKTSIRITLRGADDDTFSEDPLGTVQADISKGSGGRWPRGSFSRASENPADFVLYYRVEPVMALQPARPETVVASRVVSGSLTASTVSGVPVRVLRIRATVPSTPPRTARAAPASIANAWAAPADLTFESTKPLRPGAVTFTAADFNSPNALVLMRNSEGPIRLEAETDPPGVDVYFEAVRADDDAVGVGLIGDLPTIAQTGAGTATMATDQRGSFYVLAFLDLNRNNRRNDDEAGMILPVVLVEAKINNFAADMRSAANPDNLDISLDGVNGQTHAANYTYAWCRSGDFASQATAAVAFDADVLLIGGGADGRRGVDRVFLGWSNDVISWRQRGTYRDARVVDQVQVDNAGAATGGNQFGIPVFISGAAAPNIYPQYPPVILDTGRHDPQLGGENITFTRSAVTNRAAAAPLGETHTVIARDSPGSGQMRQHPDPARNTRLQRFEFDFNSATYLVAWTNSTGGAAPSPGTANSVGFRTYTVIAETQWEIFADYNVTGAPGNINLVSGAVPQFVVANNVDHSPGVTPATVVEEVRPPVVTATWAFNAST